jgi:hypothetical protein
MLLWGTTLGPVSDRLSLGAYNESSLLNNLYPPPAAMSLVDTFRGLLSERLDSQGLTVSMWNDGVRPTKHLLVVSVAAFRFRAKKPPRSTWLAMLGLEMDGDAPTRGDGASILPVDGAHGALKGQASPDFRNLASDRTGETSTASQPALLYVKLSTKIPGTWGLTPNRLDHLSASGMRWYCVLLYQSASAGYLLPGDQILARVDDSSLTRLHDGDYIVNQRAKFMSSQRFESIDALVSRAF